MPTTLADALCTPERMNDAAAFAEYRATLREQGGAVALHSELEGLGFVGLDGNLTTGTKPFNIFARVASGRTLQPGMEEEIKSLGQSIDQFMIAANRPENDTNWASAHPEWVGKASMGARHRFMTLRDLSWSWFNVAAFGLAGAAQLREAVELLEAMEVAAKAYASKMGWSANVGLYFHAYGYSSVNSLHMHIVDLDETGPTFDALSFKNLPLQDVLQVLCSELEAASNTEVDHTETIAADLVAEVIARATEALPDARLGSVVVKEAAEVAADEAHEFVERVFHEAATEAFLDARHGSAVAFGNPGLLWIPLMEYKGYFKAFLG